MSDAVETIVEALEDTSVGGVPDLPYTYIIVVLLVLILFFLIISFIFRR